MAERKPHDTPSDIEAEGGHVYVEGPDNVAFAMTPGAAMATAERLRESAVTAQKQILG